MKEFPAGCLFDQACCPLFNHRESRIKDRQVCQSWEIRYEDNKAIISNEGQLKDRDVG